MNSRKYLLLCNAESTTIYGSRLQSLIWSSMIRLHPMDTFYFGYYVVIFFMHVNAYYNAYFNDFNHFDK
jgi:hypothetical protein